MDSLKMLKIDESVIPQSILNVMHEGIAFTDADKELGEIIYYGSIFDLILDNHQDGHYEIPHKDMSYLTELIKLSEEYQYILVAKL
jgi:hypothetical protein